MPGFKTGTIPSTAPAPTLLFVLCHDSRRWELISGVDCRTCPPLSFNCKGEFQIIWEVSGILLSEFLFLTQCARILFVLSLSCLSLGDQLNLFSSIVKVVHDSFVHKNVRVVVLYVTAFTIYNFV